MLAAMKVSERPRAVVSWSSGKDSAFALHEVLSRESYDVVGLLTTTSCAPASAGQTSAPTERVAMHGVRRSLLEAQSRALQLPVAVVELPWPCANTDYQARMGDAVAKLVSEGVSTVIFGDIFLEDVRTYREEMLAGCGLTPVFPLWGRDTRELAQAMFAAGIRAHLSCVDLNVLGADVVGRQWDAELLAALPAGVDPCGENGEFHTFVSAAPGFSTPIDLDVGERIERDGFAWADMTERTPA